MRRKRTRTDQWSPSKLKRETLRRFQEMVRAEAAARTQPVYAVCDGQIELFESPLGECVCVTCSHTTLWNVDKAVGLGMDGGHYLAGKVNAVCLDERACHPQCPSCNGHLSGNAQAYEMYMCHRYGSAVIDELKLRHNLNKMSASDRDVVKVTSDWVSKRAGFMARTKIARQHMARGVPLDGGKEESS